MSNEKAHALVLAETLMNISNGRSPQSESFNAAAATELQTLHFRVQELEAMLDALGAGGVSAQRVMQGKDHIAQDRKMVAAPVELPEPEAWMWRKSIVDSKGRTAGVSQWHYSRLRGGLPWGEAYRLYTEQQVRELLAKDIDPIAAAKEMK